MPCGLVQVEVEGAQAWATTGVDPVSQELRSACRDCARQLKRFTGGA